MPLFNNIVFKLEAGISTIGNLLIIAEGKETLIPDFTELEIEKRFKLTLTQFVGNIVAQMEIVRVISKTGKNLIIQRAVEPCPLNGNAKIMSQIAYEFKAGDIAKMTMTAGEENKNKEEITNIQERVKRMEGIEYTIPYKTPGSWFKLGKVFSKDMDRFIFDILCGIGYGNYGGVGGSQVKINVSTTGGSISGSWMELGNSSGFTNVSFVHLGNNEYELYIYINAGSNPYGRVLLTFSGTNNTYFTPDYQEITPPTSLKFEIPKTVQIIDINSLNQATNPNNGWYGIFTNGAQNFKVNLWDLCNGLRTSSDYEAGVVRLSKDSEASDGTNNGIAITPKQAKENYGFNGITSLSDNVKFSETTEYTRSESGFVTIKTLSFGYMRGGMRIKAQYRANSEYYSTYIRIIKNGVQINEQWTNSPSYINYQYDIEVNYGDVVQIQYGSSQVHAKYIRYISVSYDITTIKNSSVNIS